MAINISYQPSAAAIGGAGLMAGNADFNRWRATQLAQQWAMGVGAAQNAQQMNLSRLNALSQIANDQQQQQSQQQFELQKLPMQAQLEAQQQQFQSNLQGQNQTNQALLQGSLHAQQSTQDFGEQQALMNMQSQENLQRDQAQRQAQVEGQQTVAAYNDRIKQGLQDRAMMQNPLQQHMQMMEQAQKSGYSFTPEENTQVKQIKSDIGAIQQAVSDNTLSMGDAIKQMKPAVSRLNSITPSQAPPETTEQKIDKNIVMGIRGPDGQVLKGTEGTPFTVDAKTGTPMVVRGWKGEEAPTFDEEGNPVFQSEKARGQWLKNQKSEGDVELQAYHEAQKAVQAEKRGNPFFGVDPATGTPIPGYEDQRLQMYEAQIAQRLARRPSGAGAVPAGTPHPAGNPGGQPGIAPGEAPGEAPQPGAGGAPQPPPAGIPAPAQGAPQGQQGYHFDQQVGPVQNAPAQTQQGPPPGAFQHNPATTAQQFEHQAVSQYLEVSKSLPPEWKAKKEVYVKAGKHNGAVAVAGMYLLMAQLGPDASKWPPSAIKAAQDFRREAPDV